jgi:GT2 family glycosyltransferase
MSISFVTVTHNSRGHIERYVRSFLASGSGKKDVRMEFIFVENSGDENLDQLLDPLRDAGFAVRLIKVENLGFACGCNRGAREAQFDIIAFVNPDVEFLGVVDGLMALEGSWGTVAQLNERSNLHSFGVLPEEKSVFGELTRRYESMTPPPDGWLHKVFPAGSFFCIDRSLFEGVGGFDESFFLYHEEAELARRLHKVAGPPKYLPQIEVQHRAFGSQISQRRTLDHEMTGFFQYARITGERWMLVTRFVTLVLLFPFRPIARFGFGFFLKNMYRMRKW